MRKWLGLALLVAPLASWSQDTRPLEMQLRQLDAIHVMELAADLQGRNLVAVWPAQSRPIDLPRGKRTVSQMRQVALNALSMKAVQRGDIEIAVPGCQRVQFQSSFTVPK